MPQQRFSLEQLASWAVAFCAWVPYWTLVIPVLPAPTQFVCLFLHLGLLLVGIALYVWQLHSPAAAVSEFEHTFSPVIQTGGAIEVNYALLEIILQVV